MVLHEASENYLEAILILSEKQEKVRSIDVCHFFGHAKSTVSVAMKKLKENDYIRMDEDGYIELTQKGRQLAEKIYERHVIVAKLFMQLGVEEKTAFEDSCRIEHDISEETFLALKNLYLQGLEKEEKER